MIDDLALETMSAELCLVYRVWREEQARAVVAGFANELRASSSQGRGGVVLPDGAPHPTHSPGAPSPMAPRRRTDLPTGPATARFPFSLTLGAGPDESPCAD